MDFRPVWVTAGRAYFSVGQGIAYADVGDGVEMSFKTPKFNLKTFVSQSLPHQDNIDTSVPGYDKHTKRLFYGAECDYLGIPGQNIYGFAVFQRDKSKAEPDDPEHDFKYNSEYYGLGLRGKLRPTVSYWWEIIGEKGKSFIFETNEKENISAWANVFVLAYEPQIYSHPEYHFKYAFASGDKGRVSVTNTENGNAAGKDTNFLYFGYLPTGYALSPQLSNLQFFKGGAEFKPFEKNRLFKDFSLGMDYYRFYKARSTGGIDDDAATEDSSDVGQELDANLSWQIFSDLNFSVEYGYFWPGKAYPIITHDNEQYVSVSTTFTF